MGSAAALLLPVGDPAARQIVRRELELHSIAGKDADAELAHLSRSISEHGVLVVELDPVVAAGELLAHRAFDFDSLLFLRHAAPSVTGLCGSARLRKPDGRAALPRRNLSGNPEPGWNALQAERRRRPASDYSGPSWTAPRRTPSRVKVATLSASERPGSSGRPDATQRRDTTSRGSRPDARSADSDAARSRLERRSPDAPTKRPACTQRGSFNPSSR